jgi:hypothetical protein
MVLRGDLDLSGPEVDDRVIGAVVAHLQEDPAAPPLAHEDKLEDSGAEDANPPSKPGLNADDFAAFLKRRKQD